MYPINEVTNMNWLAVIHDGEFGSLPTIYLGLPLGAKSKSIEIWDRVIKKCENKLSQVENSIPFLRGRPTLINSVLDALPTYMMPLFPIPTRGYQKVGQH